MKFKVSIIVPIYNVEKYVKRCVESLMNQTYQNIEIILVNDGSTDSSYDRCIELAKLDNRIKIINKKNEGVSKSRNLGIKKASGEFILFVDADDYLDVNTVNILIQLINSNEKIDVILFPFIKEYNNKSIKTKLFKNDYILFDNYEVKNKILSNLIGPNINMKYNPLSLERLNTVWGKLYRAVLIKNLEFVDTTIIGPGEDGLFNINVFNNCKGSVLYTESIWYHYEKSNQTSFLHKDIDNYIEKRWNFYTILRNKILEMEQDFSQNLNNRIILELFIIILKYRAKKDTLKNKVNELKKLSREYNYELYWKNFDFKNLSFFWKSFYFLCRIQYFYVFLLFSKNNLKGGGHSNE